MKKNKTLTCEEFKNKIDMHEDFILVDVLSDPDFHKLHISGAINIALADLEAKANQWLSRHIDIIVYSANHICKGAEFAQEILGKMGFRVWTIDGGLEEWGKHQYPTEGDFNYKPQPILTPPASLQPKPASVEQPAQKEPQGTPGQQQKGQQAGQTTSKPEEHKQEGHKPQFHKKKAA